MAKEYRGVLMVMAAILCLSKGIQSLNSRKYLIQTHDINEWLLLFEMILKFESFLCVLEMKVRHVMLMQRKNRYILYMLKRIGKREEGMHWSLQKFHGATHIALDVFLFGVPMEVDTGFEESHHKNTKVAANLTQKNIGTFEFQTCTCLMSFLPLTWPWQRLKGAKCGIIT
jgi:hypothetical protein